VSIGGGGVSIGGGGVNGGGGGGYEGGPNGKPRGGGGGGNTIGDIVGNGNLGGGGGGGGILSKIGPNGLSVQLLKRTAFLLRLLLLLLKLEDAGIINPGNMFSRWQCGHTSLLNWPAHSRQRTKTHSRHFLRKLSL